MRPFETDRVALKAALRECDESAVRWRAAHDGILKADHAINEAVAKHAEITSEIQAGLHNNPTPERQAELTARLDAANGELDATCKSMRDRIGALQTQLILTQQAQPDRNRIERSLQLTASLELQHSQWHLEREITWIEARRTASRKALANARATLATRNGTAEAAHKIEVERWATEYAQIDAQRSALLAESENLRQEMLNE